MWNPIKSQIQLTIEHYQIANKEGVLLTFQEVIENWKFNDLFNAFFSNMLAESNFRSYFWELPALTKENLEMPFECVLVKSERLTGIQADIQPFANYFIPGELVVSFANLGGDATLIAPTPDGPLHYYPHLAAFVETLHCFKWNQCGHW